MSINKRLEKFLFEKKISQEDLRIKIGIKNKQQISNWITCVGPIPPKHLLRIIEKYPELNANWLIRDIGAMLMSQQQLRQINRNESGFCEECLEKQKEIERLTRDLKVINEEVRDLYRKEGMLSERLVQYEKKKNPAK